MNEREKITRRKNELAELHAEWRDREPLGLEDVCVGSNDDANEPFVDAFPMVRSNNDVDGSVVPATNRDPIVDYVPSVRDDFVADEGEIGESEIPSASI